MIEIQIRYTLPQEKDLTEFYQKRIADEHIATAISVHVLQV